MAETLVNEGQKWFLDKAFEKQTLVNEVQSVTIDATGGNFKLVFEGQTTADIAWNAAASTVKTQLEGLSSIGSGNVDVTGSAGGPYMVTFLGFLHGTPVPQLTSTNTLTGGASTVSHATSVQGFGTIPQFLYMGLSQDTRENLGDAVTLASISEVTGTGYSRQRVKTNDTELTKTLTGGFRQVKSKVVTFSATAGNWTIAKSLFLTDVPSGTSGSVISLRTVPASFTLGNGQSVDLDLTEAGADPA